MSWPRRREMVNQEHAKLPIMRQCALLVPVSTIVPKLPQDASKVDRYRIDRQYLETPFNGSRRMKAVGYR